jgi:predicted nucleic acid-binding Zn finger protein
MYDLSTRKYRHRDLFLAPFTLKDAVAAVKPPATVEAKAAQVIFTADNVRIIARRPFSAGFKVSGSARGASGERVRPLITVNLKAEIVEGTCTCPFFRSHQLTKGPCEHLLALRLAHMTRLAAEDEKGGPSGKEG